MVLPVNTPGYASQKPMSEYSWDTVSSYIEAGLVYAHAGVRGKDSMTDSYLGNAPWGVTDLKAAVRFLRFNADALPIDKGRFYCFGHSGGGAQTAIMGASGDSELYNAYLSAIGAVMDTSDAANLAYEWQMGQFASTGTRAEGTWTRAYSLDLANAYGDYLNGLGLSDGSTRLTLKQSGEGAYLAGTYYDKILSVIEDSLNDFLKVTTFP